MVQIKNPLNIPTHDLDYVVKAVDTGWESLRNGRLLLTGGTGFIGFHVIKKAKKWDELKDKI